jgi:hypothetical protein
MDQGLEKVSEVLMPGHASLCLLCPGGVKHLTMYTCKYQDDKLFWCWYHTIKNLGEENFLLYNKTTGEFAFVENPNPDVPYVWTQSPPPLEEPSVDDDEEERQAEEAKSYLRRGCDLSWKFRGPGEVLFTRYINSSSPCTGCGRRRTLHKVAGDKVRIDDAKRLYCRDCTDLIFPGRKKTCSWTIDCASR